MTLAAEEGVQAGAPGGVEIGARGEPPVELEDRHAVREGPQRPGEVRVSARRRDDGRGRALLDPGREALARERPARHQAVEMRMLAREAAVHASERHVVRRLLLALRELLE